ncbi:Regulator of carotenoid biosynthesis, Transcriptional regulator, PpsR [Roseibacterium elongatum DSM 19469]|uniref:Regulator of carotenoid biosynthesis, Transcriptional regulator, PpsR n=1 Tax=Roseicyclus elongatus DSM 19469 TaxID=1294273 RepID=W8RQR4_9RHOB|nr:transcriptional regulator PpsR [Roseibacterium elongatum]AHM03489.1 Regulator of carotenoid biosynthesis, Transcriptional regulator, PpsR [Roseibacterium elongatum DSM 19469]
MNTRGTDFWDYPSPPPIGPEQFNEIVTTAADLAIVLDTAGTVKSVVTNPLNPSLGQLDHWKDRDIREFTAEDSLGKLEAQLTAYREGKKPKVDAIEVNHFDNANWEFPIRYTIHKTGNPDIILMLGRDLRPIAELQHRLVKAQLALEKDYESHRDYETRYRVVMEAVRDALVLVDVASGRVLDLNTVAAQILGAEADALTGSAFTQEFDGRRRGEFLEELVNAAGDEAAGSTTAKTRRGKVEVAIYPTVFRAAGEKTLLCRMEVAGSQESVAAELTQTLTGMYRDGPDAVVFTDNHGVIRSANEAFLGLCDAGQLADVKGKSLGDYLLRGSVDLKVLIENAARHGKMRLYSTRFEGAYGSQLSVEVSATHLAGGGMNGFGFVIRDTSRMEVVREPGGPTQPSPAPMSDDAMRNVMDLVGSAPLKDIVSATTDVVEKMCIETAVELTDNNRVAAAEMLGLSRQSLYVKLRKYGLLHKNGG